MQPNALSYCETHATTSLHGTETILTPIMAPQKRLKLYCG